MNNNRNSRPVRDLREKLNEKRQKDQSKPGAPPPDPKYNFLADPLRDNNYNIEKRNYTENSAPARSRGGDNSNRRIGSGRIVSGGSRRPHEDDEWRRERNRIDQERINRQRTTDGNWRREWDIGKADSWKQIPVPNGPRRSSTQHHLVYDTAESSKFTKDDAFVPRRRDYRVSSAKNWSERRGSFNEKKEYNVEREAPPKSATQRPKIDPQDMKVTLRIQTGERTLLVNKNELQLDLKNLKAQEYKPQRKNYKKFNKSHQKNDCDGKTQGAEISNDKSKICRDAESQAVGEVETKFKQLNVYDKGDASVQNSK